MCSMLYFLCGVQDTKLKRIDKYVIWIVHVCRLISSIHVYKIELFIKHEWNLLLDLEKDPLLHSQSGTEFSLHLDEDMPREGRIHRMHILRMRLTYFVNSLHNYIMTRVCSISDC